MFSLFPRIHEFNVLREGFGCHFNVCWWPRGRFFWFLMVLETGWNLHVFWDSPLGAPWLREYRSWGEKLYPDAQETH